MFRTKITSTPFITSEAEPVFGDIYGGTYDEDVSFISTIRALVAPRKPKDERLEVYATLLYEFGKRDIDWLFDTERRTNARNKLSIIWFNADSTTAIMDWIAKNLEYDGWKRLNKVTEFFKKSFNALCYINIEHKSTVVFVEKMNMKIWHYLQCATFAFFPWYFNPEEGVKADEMKLIESLRESTSEKYIESLNAIISTYDLRETYIKNVLKDFESSAERVELVRAEESFRTVLSEIKSYNDAISELLNRKRNIDIQISGLKAKLSQECESELMEYFISNKNLIIDFVDGDRLSFYVKTHIEFFDEDMAGGMFDNYRSIIYRPYSKDYSAQISHECVREVMTEIFINQTLKIKTCAEYKIKLSGNVNAVQGAHFDYRFNDCLPNTHINEYACMGNYSRIINELLLNKDYIGAIEQCIASCKSLNFGDSVVIERFSKDLHEGARCIELPDKSVVTLVEASKYLQAKKA